jgi:competence protein ComEA
MDKQSLKAYFSFTKKERTGIFVVLGLLALVILLPVVFPFPFSDHPAKDEAFIRFATNWQQQQNKFKNDTTQPLDRHYPAHHYYSTHQQAHGGVLFYFDPNTLAPEGWKRLGLRDKTITTIQRYREKGGRFYQPEDIGKIWGLHDNEVSRLLPYIRIAAQSPLATNAPSSGSSRYPRYETKTPTAARLLNINMADTADWIALPGIGPTLATRIVRFREKLGGFYAISQIKEVYGLPDSVFQRILPRLQNDPAAIRRININTASVEILKAHPLIRYTLANVIVQYRQQHGQYSQIDELRNILSLSEDQYEKIRPYLTVE